MSTFLLPNAIKPTSHNICKTHALHWRQCIVSLGDCLMQILFVSINFCTFFVLVRIVNSDAWFSQFLIRSNVPLLKNGRNQRQFYCSKSMKRSSLIFAASFLTTYHIVTTKEPTWYPNNQLIFEYINIMKMSIT